MVIKYCKLEFYGNVETNPTAFNKCPVIKKKNSFSSALSVAISLAMIFTLLIWLKIVSINYKYFIILNIIIINIKIKWNFT